MASILQRIVLQHLFHHGRCMSNAISTGHQKTGQKLWKNLSFFVALPAVGLGMIYAYLTRVGIHQERPPFVPYEYMRIRKKRFPWGDGEKSLFHNPEANALSTGYEDQH